MAQPRRGSQDLKQQVMAQPRRRSQDHKQQAMAQLRRSSHGQNQRQHHQQHLSHQEKEEDTTVALVRFDMTKNKIHCYHECSGNQQQQLSYSRAELEKIRKDGINIFMEWQSNNHGAGGGYECFKNNSHLRGLEQVYEQCSTCGNTKMKLFNQRILKLQKLQRIATGSVDPDALALYASKLNDEMSQKAHDRAIADECLARKIYEEQEVPKKIKASIGSKRNSLTNKRPSLIRRLTSGRL